ncbi:MAG: hypothetical protein FWC92_07445 [Defluviitaleaceae bacterium]|nr:hypothetical protein [Defluviitaleaceae bacterium]
MYNQQPQRDTQARGQLQAHFRGHPELLETALELQTRKEQKEHEARDAKQKAMYPLPELGKPYVVY